MPVRKVGPNSYQWGNSGKVYTGKDAKAKAERQGRAIYASGYREAESYKPPASAVANAKRGLALRKEYGRGGLSPSEAKSQGIDSGVTRARKIASGKVSRHDVRRMSAFNRHRKNYRPEKKMPDGGPTAGTIAWLLWGGTSGVNWAKKKSASMNAESEEHQGDYMVPADIHRILESAVHLQQLQESHDGSYPEWWKSKLSVVASQLDNLTDVLDYKVDHPEEFDAEDYAYFTNASIAEKIVQDVYGDDWWVYRGKGDPDDPDNWNYVNSGAEGLYLGVNEFVSMLSGANFDATPISNLTDDQKDEIRTWFFGINDDMRSAEDYNSFTDELQSLIDKYGVLQSYYTTFGDNIMDVSFSFRPHDPYFDDVDFDAESPKNSRISPSAALSYLKSSPDACVWLLDWSTENYGDAGNPSYDYPVEDPDELELMIIEGVFEGPDAPDIATDKYYRAENWGGDPEGPLAKALARAREKLSQPRKPLRITSLPHPDQKTLKDFESDNWKLLPRDRMGRWRKPVDSESINRLTESLSSDVPSISELLTMYGGDTPTNRFRLYQDLQTLSLAQMDAALPDDSIVEFDEADLSWMTPEEYYQYVLEEPLNLSDDIEDDTQTVEFQDRLVRYTAMTMTPTEVDDLLEQNFKDVVADLFAPDSEDTEAEIAFLLAVKRYQEFSDRYAAE
jgi:hypothetical protein